MKNLPINILQTVKSLAINDVFTVAFLISVFVFYEPSTNQSNIETKDPSTLNQTDNNRNEKEQQNGSGVMDGKDKDTDTKEDDKKASKNT